MFFKSFFKNICEITRDPDGVAQPSGLCVGFVLSVVEKSAHIHSGIVFLDGF